MASEFDRLKIVQQGRRLREGLGTSRKNPTPGHGGAFRIAAPLGNWGGGYPLLQRICPVLHRGHDAWILY